MSLRPCITAPAIFRYQTCKEVKLGLLPTYHDHVQLALDDKFLPNLRTL